MSDQQATNSSSNQTNTSPSTSIPSSKLNNNNQQTINLNSISQSPSKFVNIDEIMKASNSISNMYLSHQIVLNDDFMITKPTDDILRNQVETAMKSTFWKILESQLNSSPPIYKQGKLFFFLIIFIFNIYVSLIYYLLINLKQNNKKKHKIQHYHY